MLSGKWLIAFAIAFVVHDGVLAEENKEHKLECICIAATSMCNFKLFDEAAGKPRVTWLQTIYENPAKPLTKEDKALACWRKRDAPKHGGGLCCSLDRDERDATRYFKGELK